MYFIVEAFITDIHCFVTAPSRQKPSLQNKIFIYIFKQTDGHSWEHMSAIQ